MAKVQVTGRVLRWGNSYGIRVRRADLDRAGLKEGTEVVVELKSGDKVDLSHIRTFRSGRSDISARHDEYFGLAAWEDLRRGRKGRRAAGRPK